MARNQASLDNSGESRVFSLDKRRTSREEQDQKRFFTSAERREAVAFLLIAGAVVIFASLVLNPRELLGIADSETVSAAGRFGKWLSTQIGILFGLGGLILPLALGFWGYLIFKQRPPRAIFAKALALAVGLISSCSLLGLVNRGGYWGGALGYRLAGDLHQTFGVVSYLIVLFTIAVSVVIGTPLSFSMLLAAGVKGTQIAWGVFSTIRDLVWNRLAASGSSVGESMRTAATRAGSEMRKRAAEAVSAALPATKKGADEKAPAGESGEKKSREFYEKTETRIVATPALKLVRKGGEDGAAEEKEEEQIEAKVAKPAVASAPPAAEPAAAVAKPSIEDLVTANYTPLENFTLPSLDLLDDPVVSEGISEEELKLKAQVLQETLAEFGIESKIGDIIPGPTVTRFEVVPSAGVKVTSITARQDDIALAMAAPSIRMEAPIPGKSAIGIEIPNRKGQRVSLKEVLSTKEFQELRKTTPLAVALGQDIAGLPVVADLRRMPHLMIAGATGAGKSVCINAIMNSLVFSSRPTEVRMILVDPKVVELQEYNDIPHLIAPVVTDARKAPRALFWAVEEMERRYQYLARAGVREIDAYNEQANAFDGEAEELDDFVDLDDEVADAGETPLPKHMPYLVVVVDEFSDLMMVAKKECEDAIIRIAQMARAVGIHLIIATQRPSVDVITGVIKANLPSRIAFLVSSRVDSMTIMDTQGAERLLGRGDMLFKPGDRPKPIRLQGCFVSGGEIKRMTKHYRDQGTAKREFNLTDAVSAGGAQDMVDGDDPFFLQALEIALKDGFASVSRLQRLLKLGHPRAARLVDMMEAKGLVTPPDGSKPRKILFDATLLDQLRQAKGE